MQPHDEYRRPPTSSVSAVTVFILGLFSVLACGLFTGLPAWLMGEQALRQINDGVGNSSDRSLVQAGRILGMIGTAISSVFVCVYLMAVNEAAGAAEASRRAATSQIVGAAEASRDMFTLPAGEAGQGKIPEPVPQGVDLVAEPKAYAATNRMRLIDLVRKFHDDSPELCNKDIALHFKQLYETDGPDSKLPTPPHGCGEYTFIGTKDSFLVKDGCGSLRTTLHPKPQSPKTKTQSNPSATWPAGMGITPEG